MRFDEYLQQHAIVAVPVDRLDGFDVEVEGPQGWEAVEDRVGMRIWAWRNDPNLQKFCANAVLTTHRVSAVLGPAEVFAMLADEQVQIVPGCHERHRECRPADGGLGVEGVLFSQFDTEIGTIDSLSRSRIIASEQATLIAQLTITALHDSPIDWTHIRLTVVPDSQPTESDSTVGNDGQSLITKDDR